SGGTIHISTLSRLYGLEGNLRHELLRNCWCHLDGLLGYRFLRKDDAVNIATVSGSTPGVDEFGANNTFQGGQIGLDWEAHYGPFYVDRGGKFAPGVPWQDVTVSGGNGLLAQATNSGRFTAGTYAIVPEVGINFGWRVCEQLRLSIGYSFLFWSHV